MTTVFLILAFIVFLIGSISLLRLPDVYTRLHATALGDTLGIGLVALALMFSTSSVSIRLKLLLILVIFWLINPTISHLTAKVALLHGTCPYNKELIQRRQQNDSRNR
ncbi:MAG: monovalent cation/H(+) antiporter subunit G [Firmicutes bacterium]|nr:monovalent cation/H(+) antiporter subunit G [Bacillota bacterium]